MLKINLENKKRIRITIQRTVGLALLLLGLITLLLATVYSASTPALIGLGLVFWGIILLYIQTEEYTRSTILDAITTSLLTALDQLLQELDYRGKAIYLPPKYLNDPEAAKAYVPKLRLGKLPTPEQTQELETRISQRNIQGMLITPPGAGLTRLLEKTLGTNFAKMSPDSLRQILPKLFIEDLEIATDLEIETTPSRANNSPDRAAVKPEAQHDSIHVRISTETFADTCRKAQQLPSIHANIGCPLTSAIALIIARTMGKPVTIEAQKISNNGRTIETDYGIFEEEPSWT